MRKIFRAIRTWWARRHAAAAGAAPRAEAPRGRNRRLTHCEARHLDQRMRRLARLLRRAIQRREHEQAEALAADYWLDAAERHGGRGTPRERKRTAR